MTTQVYINGLEIDVDQGTVVVASYANINFGALGKRSGAKTNTWKAPYSNRNKLVFDGAEIAGSWSVKPYRKATIKVDIDGVTVFEGWAVLNEANDSYEIMSFADQSDFYYIVSNSKLRDIDLSQYEHVWNDTVIKNSFTRTSGYIYAFVEYGVEYPFSRVPPSYLKPQIFFKDVIAAIVEYAGYSIEGDVLTHPLYLKHMIIPSDFPFAYSYGQTIDLAAILPDLNQSKVWLDFVNMYGLQVEVDDKTKHIIVTYIDDLLFNAAEDWTNKLDRSERAVVNYRFSTWGQLTSLKFKEFSAAGGKFSDYRQDIAIDDETLKDEADLYKSEFSLINNQSAATVWNAYLLTRARSFSGIWDAAINYVYNGSEGTVVLYNGTYYENLQSSTGDVPPSSPTYWQAIAEDDVFDVNSRPMYGVLEIDPGFYINVAYTGGDEIITRKITNRGLTWPELYPQFYRIFERITVKTKIVDMLIKLNHADINQLDFTTPKFIDNELYMIQEVKQFKLNQVDSTIVTFVRI